MPNRILKDSVCTSDNLDTLDASAERFFYRLMVQCDDFGRMDARLPILLARCFPLKLATVIEQDISNWLKQLIDAHLIYLYTDDGRPYLQFVTWNDHQQIRAKRSKYPQPKASSLDNTHLISDDINGNQLQSNAPENPIQSNPMRISNDIDPDLGELAKAYESNIGMITPMIKEQLQDDLVEYGLGLCRDAIEKSVSANVRKWTYVHAILKNWKLEGKRELETPKPRKNGTVKGILSDGTIVEAAL